MCSICMMNRGGTNFTCPVCGEEWNLIDGQWKSVHGHDGIVEDGSGD